MVKHKKFCEKCFVLLYCTVYNDYYIHYYIHMAGSKSVLYLYLLGEIAEIKLLVLARGQAAHHGADVEHIIRGAYQGAGVACCRVEVNAGEVRLLSRKRQLQVGPHDLPEEGEVQVTAGEGERERIREEETETDRNKKKRNARLQAKRWMLINKMNKSVVLMAATVRPHVLFLITTALRSTQ